jgi:glycolate oxidase iron-sulfur subunit
LNARLIGSHRLSALQSGQPELIVAINIGCQLPQAAGADVSVKHWIDLLDDVSRA